MRYTVSAMNPLPAPVVPGKTEAERFNNALRKVFEAQPKTAFEKALKDAVIVNPPKKARAHKKRTPKA